VLPLLSSGVVADMLSEAFTKYVAYLALLIHEQKCDRDEGPEAVKADSYRDAMDPLWYQLTEEEIRLAERITMEIDKISS